MTTSWGSALVFVIFGALTFWLWQQLDETQGYIMPIGVHEPDYYIEDMVRNTLDENGALKNVLYADLVTHFPDDDTTELDRPRMEIYNGKSDPWYVIAESGWVSSGSEVVLLHGEVEIWRLDKTGNREFEVITSELRVLPQEQYAETSDPATITSKATISRTIGMRANFAHDRLELLKQVRSRHEVNPQI
ncbi:MAG TPA: LPS export ABC transporter periplasmic protein LptC [Gammaproteobacteria bacterium]|nr:LPS export ABC transporter periplasmic protein LptC [Gammaproteobacteria bacterium]